MSKVGVTVMTFIQQRELNSREDIVVNAVRYITNINISLNLGVFVVVILIVW